MGELGAAGILTAPDEKTEGEGGEHRHHAAGEADEEREGIAAEALGDD
ncbi:MAG: hypothetical protein GX620_15955, partial [Chloroflexi bacterium]|nr:hypothetical protein [Chloroflexota bacterium]